MSSMKEENQSADAVEQVTDDAVAEEVRRIRDAMALSDDGGDKEDLATYAKEIARLRTKIAGLEPELEKGVQPEMVTMPAEPEISNEMKAALIGEFSWQEEAPYYDEDGGLHEDYVASHVVPWTVCKDIFKRFYAMAVAAAREPGKAGRTGGGE